MKDKILAVLINKQHQYISGEALAEECGISRAAIWKHINNLKKDGYKIETLNKKGYKLVSNDEKLLSAEIQAELKTKEIGVEILHFDSIDSTNSCAKAIAETKASGTLIISEEQVAGRGRQGRQWTSTKGEGIFMSIILKPKLPPLEGSKLTQIAAAAVCIAIRNITALDAKIKWPNDIVIDGKKVCGILTEMAAELNEVHYLVVGIGINVNNSYFPKEISDKATSLFLAIGNLINRRELLCEVINNMELLYHDFLLKESLEKSIEICRSFSAVVDKSVVIHQGGKELRGRAIDITYDGLLKVELEDGGETSIISGEVSVRGEKGYI